MPEDLVKSVEQDMQQIPYDDVSASTERENAMKLAAHMLLRLWTRFALETGRKLDMAPSPHALGMYEGKMNWALNETANYRTMDRIELGGSFGRRHALIAEVYSQRGDDRIRLVFSLEEDEVRGKPVFVNYHVYDAPLAEFRVEKAVHALRPALKSWFETIVTASDAPLWGYCSEKLECVGV